MSKKDSLNLDNTDGHLLRVGYYSTGWPLSRFPNGIIAYIQNMLAGLDGQASPVVLTDHFESKELNEEVVDITQYPFNKSFPKKLIDRVLARLKSKSVDSIRYSNFLTF
ncbi:MAG: hypothetical protein ACXW1T_08975, partial [Methylophilus sp.]